MASKYNMERLVEVKEGEEVPATIATLGYKIKYKGEYYHKKKFSDLGKIKSSLLIAFGYYSAIHNHKVEELHPEVAFSDLPGWMYGSGGGLTLEEFKDVEIVSLVGNGRKQTPVEFDAYAYIKEASIKLKAITDYGMVVKDMFTKLKEDSSFPYFLTYSPEEYAQYRECTACGWSSPRWAEADKWQEKIKELPESPVVVDALKALKLGKNEFKKVTKYGKTAIAVQTEDQLFALVELLPAERVDYFMMDTEGVHGYNKEMKRKISINNLLK